MYRSSEHSWVQLRTGERTCCISCWRETANSFLQHPWNVYTRRQRRRLFISTAHFHILYVWPAFFFLRRSHCWCDTAWTVTGDILLFIQRTSFLKAFFSWARWCMNFNMQEIISQGTCCEACRPFLFSLMRQGVFFFFPYSWHFHQYSFKNVYFMFIGIFCLHIGIWVYLLSTKDNFIMMIDDYYLEKGKNSKKSS